MITIEAFTFEERVELLKQILDTELVVVNAAYGESEELSSDQVRVNDDNSIDIDTNICTG